MDKNKFNYVLGLTRITMGWMLLWAFLDKTFGLGFATAREKSWILGVSPTAGFLTNVVHGPFTSFYHILVGNVFVDWLFMIGLLLIGLSLILGIFNKLATYSGCLLFLLMFLAGIPPSNNPIIDDHIIYILVLLLLNLFNAGDYIGLGKRWKKFYLVRKFSFLE